MPVDSRGFDMIIMSMKSKIIVSDVAFGGGKSYLKHHVNVCK